MKMVTSAISGERYAYAPVSDLYLFGRAQDFALQKARDNIHQRNHLRLWLSPMRYRGKQVWVGQISRDIGSRLTIHSPTFTTHKIDPDVDEARNALAEDMAYSQNLAEARASARGVGAAPKDAPRENLTTDPVLHRRSPPRAGVRPQADVAGGDRVLPVAADRAMRVKPAVLSLCARVSRSPWPAARRGSPRPSVDDSALREPRRVTATAQRRARQRGRCWATQTAGSMFGPDIDKANVQPVWIEVENRDVAAAVAAAHRAPIRTISRRSKWRGPCTRALAGSTNARIDDHVSSKLAFQNPIPPGATHAGVIFTNPQRGTMLLNIDLFGQKTLVPFSLFLPCRDAQRRGATAPERRSSYPQSQITDYARPRRVPPRSSGCRAAPPMPWNGRAIR